MAEWSLDYMSAVQIYNRFHAKFYRSHPAWFQVKLFYRPLSLCLTVSFAGRVCEQDFALHGKWSGDGQPGRQVLSPDRGEATHFWLAVLVNNF